MSVTDLSPIGVAYVQFWLSPSFRPNKSLLLRGERESGVSALPRWGLGAGAAMGAARAPRARGGKNA